MTHYTTLWPTWLGATIPLPVTLPIMLNSGLVLDSYTNPGCSGQFERSQPMACSKSTSFGRYKRMRFDTTKSDGKHSHRQCFHVFFRSALLIFLQTWSTWGGLVRNNTVIAWFREALHREQGIWGFSLSVQTLFVAQNYYRRWIGRTQSICQ